MKKLNKIIGVIALSTLFQSNSINKRQKNVNNAITTKLKNIRPGLIIKSTTNTSHDSLYKVVIEDT
jgi:hypothetical protein